jgi:hypothetical protein
MLFLDRTPWRPTPFGLLAVAFTGLLGAFAVSAWNRETRRRAEALMRAMDQADAEELRLFADTEEHCFRVTGPELTELRLDPPTFRQEHGLLTWRRAGTLSFRHRKAGRFAFALREPEEMRRAVAHLPPLFGPRLSVNAAWDKEQQRFLPKPDAAEAPEPCGQDSA